MPSASSPQYFPDPQQFILFHICSGYKSLAHTHIQPLHHTIQPGIEPDHIQMAKKHYLFYIWLGIVFIANKIQIISHRYIHVYHLCHL